MATLDDIAHELGISKGTVSKALNGAKDVSKKMQQAVRLLHFHYNASPKMDFVA